MPQEPEVGLAAVLEFTSMGQQVNVEDEPRDVAARAEEVVEEKRPEVAARLSWL